MKWPPRGVAVAVVMFASGCGSHHHAATLGFRDCINAWNDVQNTERRARVAGAIVPEGFARAGVQLSMPIGGVRVRTATPNPVGCRVVFFNRDRWVAFLAGRRGSEFHFRAAMLGREEGDQNGIWPGGTLPGPDNARVLAAAKLALRPFAGLLSDWTADGHVDGVYSCAVARAAVAHLSADAPEIGTPVRVYERKVC